MDLQREPLCRLSWLGGWSITNGGYVTTNGSVAYVAFGPDSTGRIDFGTSNGGTLTTKSLYVSPTTQLTGDGRINTNGLVADTDLTFDSTHGLNQTLTLTAPP